MNNDDRFYGNYRGKVIRNDDPFENNRIKVRIYGVYDDLEEQFIPWAIYADPLMGGQQDIGSSIVPDIDSEVWVFFEGGDHHEPVYFAGAPAMSGRNNPHAPVESREEGEYPSNKVFKTKAGFTFEIDDTENQTRLKITQPSGNVHESDHDGNANDTIKGNKEENISGTLTINVEGKTIINAPEVDLGDPAQLQESLLGENMRDYLLDHLHFYINNTAIVTGNLGAPSSTVITPIEPGEAASGGNIYSKINRNS